MTRTITDDGDLSSAALEESQRHRASQICARARARSLAGIGIRHARGRGRMRGARARNGGMERRFAPAGGGGDGASEHVNKDNAR